ncbi:isoaspartyl peptidase/L-asparaginase [Taibaiella chishuiensis]|uniref:Asparaginase n=1 Tax=Taibaiella chishuiensis TaxID=1434707 RepID=A0A2P8CVT8_9BACT|nr:isoaspartyl peptidase/L-asparaginase [Taibaiella chishuiensis]PSK89060.1 asparaginase [Taibaiella chishuiensis]
MYAIVIHGGAGTIDARLLDAGLQRQYEAGLQDALDQGFRVLEAGGAALDAVCSAVTALEDCPLFNAGRGAVFNHEGRQELDASLMRGDTGQAGAVCGVRNVRNPVLLARLVMERSQHVLLSAAGAEAFGREQGIVFEDDAYFFDAFRYEQYKTPWRRVRPNWIIRLRAIANSVRWVRSRSIATARYALLPAQAA